MGIRLHSLENIGIVSAGQSTVTGNDNIQTPVGGSSGKIRTVNMLLRRRDIKQSRIECFKIRAAMLNPLLGAPQLAGRHQFHGLGDLHGALYAFDAQLDFLH